MSNSFLILNAGSSSLKFSLLEDGCPPTLALRGQIEGLQTAPHFVAWDARGAVVATHAWEAGKKLSHDEAIEFLFDWRQRHQRDSSRLVAVGHRVVHGGAQFTKPVLIDDDVLTALGSLVPLAPLHQPHNLSAIRAVAKHWPDLPQVACFDTSFHRTQPPVARHFAIPRELTNGGIERYGFHGLSYEYIASRLPHIDPQAASGRTIVAHLGNGASLCALKSCVSIATTMSFTPLDGLMMGTRCGAIDPGVLIYLMQEREMDAVALNQLLTNESGLLGVSEISSDMRTLLEKESTDARSAEAIELFVYRISCELGSMAAALGGLDALVFTGGIGENAAAIRERVCCAAEWLGVEFDSATNHGDLMLLSKASSRVKVWVVPTNEEVMIACHTRDVLRKKT